MATNLQLWSIKIVLVCSIVMNVVGNTMCSELLLFDATTAMTPYKKMLDVSMLIAGDVSVLTQDCLLMHDRHLLEDALAGRIIRLWVAMQELLASCKQGKQLLTDDIEYLAKIVDNTSVAYEAAIVSPDFSVAISLLHHVRHTLETLLTY